MRAAALLVAVAILAGVVVVGYAVPLRVSGVAYTVLNTTQSSGSYTTSLLFATVVNRYAVFSVGGPVVWGGDGWYWLGIANNFTNYTVTPTLALLFTQYVPPSTWGVVVGRVGGGSATVLWATQPRVALGQLLGLPLEGAGYPYTPFPVTLLLSAQRLGIGYTVDYGSIVAGFASEAGGSVYYAAPARSAVYPWVAVVGILFLRFYTTVWMPNGYLANGTVGTFDLANYSSVLVARLAEPGLTLEWATLVNLSGASSVIGSRVVKAWLWSVRGDSSGAWLVGTLVAGSSQLPTTLPVLNATFAPYLVRVNSSGGVESAYLLEVNATDYIFNAYDVAGYGSKLVLVGGLISIGNWSSVPAVAVGSSIYLVRVAGVEGYLYRIIPCGGEYYAVGYAYNSTTWGLLVAKLAGLEPPSVVWAELLTLPGRPLVVDATCWGPGWLVVRGSLYTYGPAYNAALNSIVVGVEPLTVVVDAAGAAAAWSVNSSEAEPLLVGEFGGATPSLASTLQGVAYSSTLEGYVAVEAPAGESYSRSLLVEAQPAPVSVQPAPLSLQLANITSLVAWEPVTMSSSSLVYAASRVNGSVVVEATQPNPYVPTLHLASSGVLSVATSSGVVEASIVHLAVTPTALRGGATLYASGLPLCVASASPYPIVVAANSTCTSVAVSSGYLNLTLARKAVVAVAAPPNGLAGVAVNGIILCSSGVNCESLRGSDGVISFDPVTVSLRLEPSAELGGRLVAHPPQLLPLLAPLVLAAAALLLRRS